MEKEIQFFWCAVDIFVGRTAYLVYYGSWDSMLFIGIVLKGQIVPKKNQRSLQGSWPSGSHHSLLRWGRVEFTNRSGRLLPLATKAKQNLEIWYSQHHWEFLYILIPKLRIFSLPNRCPHYKRKHTQFTLKLKYPKDDTGLVFNTLAL